MAKHSGVMPSVLMGFGWVVGILGVLAGVMSLPITSSNSMDYIPAFAMIVSGIIGGCILYALGLILETVRDIAVRGRRD